MIEYGKEYLKSARECKNHQSLVRNYTKNIYEKQVSGYTIVKGLERRFLMSVGHVVICFFVKN